MINQGLDWKTSHFNELNTKHFHDLIQLRINVFVVEQNRPYPELDDKDLAAHHIYASNAEGEVLATARLLPPGISYDIPSIGRVVVREDYRDKKLGHDLMSYTMEKAIELYPNQDIKISAQEHLKNYYQKHNFNQISETYLEDGIPHIAMLYSSGK